MFDGSRAVAVIPTIFESRYLDALIVNLARCDVAVFVVNNHPALVTSTADAHSYGNLYRLMFRKWPIYRTWNFGLRVGAVWDLPTLVLNDDIVLGCHAIDVMIDTLRDEDWAILGFDYGYRPKGVGPIEAHGSYRHGGIGGFAFACNPRLCARIDRRFMWWGGDDDLFLSTEISGARTGVLRGAVVEHPEPSLSANARPELLPPGWAALDRRLLKDRHGSSW